MLLVQVIDDGSRGRAITRTLRLDEDVDRKLRALAERDRVNINVIADKSLRRHVEWEALAERFRFIAVSHDLLVKMLDYIPEEGIRELGKWSILNSVRGIYPLKGESLFIEIATLDYIGGYSRRYKIDQHVTGENLALVLTHQMGNKWSILYEEVLKAILEDHLGREVKSFKIEKTENQVVANIVVQRSSLEVGLEGPRLKN